MMKRMSLGTSLILTQAVQGAIANAFADMYTTGTPRTPLHKASDLNNVVVIGTPCILLAVIVAMSAAMLISRHISRRSGSPKSVDERKPQQAAGRTAKRRS